MKKVFVASMVLILSASIEGKAEGYSYSQDRIVQGFGSPVQSVSQPVQQQSGRYPVYAAPVSPQGYGFYQNTSNGYQGSSSNLIWYPTARQRAQGFGQPPYDDAGYVPSAGGYQRYQSPVYKQDAPRKRFFYVGAQVGMGSTRGWRGHLDHPLVAVWGLTLGTNIKPNVRADVEWLYHMKGKLDSAPGTRIDYKQHSLGANFYYDFPTQSVVRPFVGVGIWGVKGKISGQYRRTRDIDVSSDVKLAFSIAAGLSYKVTEEFSLMSLLRARYIMSKDDVYNLEGLLGVKYHF